MRFGSFLPGADLFDAAAFSTSEAEALLMDPQQRLLMEAVGELLLGRAGRPGMELSARREVGVFVGLSTVDYLKVRLGAVWLKCLRCLDLMVSCGIYRSSSTPSGPGACQCDALGPCCRSLWANICPPPSPATRPPAPRTAWPAGASAMHSACPDLP